MKIVFNKKTICLFTFCILVICFAWWFIAKEKTNPDINLINLANLSDEFMENYFDSYAQITAENNQENTLIIISPSRPNEYGAKNIIEGPNHTYYLAYDTVEERDLAYTKFEKDDTISVEKNHKMQILDYYSWGIPAMGMDQALITGASQSQTVKVAIIDTGLNVELFRRYFPSKTLSVYNVITGTDNDVDMADAKGHGTHIAGTIAEGTTSQTSILAIKANRSDTELFISDVNTAIYKAINEGADVINMSFGSSESSNSLKLAIDAATAENILI